MNGQLNLEDYKNHPTVRQLKCEHLEAALTHYQHKSATSQQTDEFRTPTNETIEQSTSGPTLNKQFNIKISVGNVSKYLRHDSSGANVNREASLQAESSQYNQDLITHKWMIYIRSPNCLRLDNYIKKVIFYLHSSYKPYDIVEVK